MDRSTIEMLENLPDIKTFRLTNRIRTNAELSTYIQNMMHLPERKNQREYPHISVAYANDENEAAILLSDYRRQGYQYTIRKLEDEERTDLEALAVRDTRQLVVLLDERYYYDEKGYLRASYYDKSGNSYVRTLFHKLNHAKENIAFIVKNNEQVYGKLLDLLQ